MLGSLARRERRPLWGTFAFILVAAVGLSVWAALNARSEAAGEAEVDAELAAQTELAPLLQPRDLTSPITGDRATELTADIERSITSVSPVDDVRIFSPLGRILYAQDPKFVGTRPSYLRNLTFEVASGGETQSIVRDGLLQTYVPVWLSSGGDVAVAELSQPFGPVVAEASADWYRIALIAGALMLGCVAMVAVCTRSGAGSPATMQLYTPALQRRHPRDAQPIAFETPLYLQPGFRAIEEQRQEAERRAGAVEENFRAVQKRLKEALAQVKELEARLSMNEAQNGTNDGELAALRDQLRETSERLHKAELDNNALRERMSLRQQELDEARRMISEVRTGGQDALHVRLEAADRRAGEMERELGRLESELATAASRFQPTTATGALHELESDDDLEIEQEDDIFEHPLIIRNATNESSPQRVR